MKIRRSTWFVIAICFISWCSFTARPNPGKQLAAMVSGFGAVVWLVALSVRGAIKWRERGLVNLVSFSLIVLSLPLAIFCGQVIRGAVFSYNLNRWNQAVAWVLAHNEPDRDGRIELPAEYSDLAYGVHYKNEDPCGLTVDFFWGSGFPVKHTVRRYATNPEWIDMRKCWIGWRSGRVISGDWYELSG
jgi:hypothetical protein